MATLQQICAEKVLNNLLYLYHMDYEFFSNGFLNFYNEYNYVFNVCKNVKLYGVYKYGCHNRYGCSNPFCGSRVELQNIQFILESVTHDIIYIVSASEEKANKLLDFNRNYQIMSSFEELW